MTSEEPHWRKSLVKSLKERNRNETAAFEDVIQANNRFFDTILQLKQENLQLSIENERCRLSGGDGSGVHAAKIQSLEKKLLAQQEELTELHKRKGENTQQIVDLREENSKLSDQLHEKQRALNEQVSNNNSIKAEVHMLTTNENELKGLNTMLRDEYTALQLAFTSLEEKLRKTQDENQKMVDLLIEYKAKVADKLNEENDMMQRKRTEKMRKDLEDAAQDPTKLASPDRSSMGDIQIKGAPFYSCNLPTSVHMKFDSHDGEVNAVQWCPMDRLVATGGADRKVKMWDVGKGVLEARGSLVGSNAGINSIDFDSSGGLLLATSNDFASRVWTVCDQRLRHSLTGHSGKVMAGKFLVDATKVVTGSHDRTLKIWDLRSRACIETKFAGSICNDLVVTDGSGTTIISGHFDKKIRFWDTRADSSASDIILQGKITSLDLSKDCKFLLCCVRDDTIKLLDLRTNQVLRTFSDENFKVGCDWTRVAFNMDASAIAAGSADGSVYVWHSSGRLATILKDGGSAVTAVHWHPFSSVLASVDRSKTCTIWCDS